MKKKLLVPSILLQGLVGILLFSGCASTSIKELSGEEFLNQANQIEQINSFHWTTYIGHTQDRVYLEYEHPAYIGNGVRSTVYWTPISELPKDIAKQLKSGNVPWKSRLQKNK